VTNEATSERNAATPPTEVSTCPKPNETGAKQTLATRPEDVPTDGLISQNQPINTGSRTPGTGERIFRRVTLEPRRVNLTLFSDPLPAKRRSYTVQLAAFLKRRPGVWVPAVDLEIFGRHAWRTRLSEARRRFAMRIDNRLLRVPTGATRSEYRYIPPEESTDE
jgi:hypothetical protein